MLSKIADVRGGVNPEAFPASSGTGASGGKLIKGMLELDHKNVITDLTSKSKSWTDIGVPKEI